MKNKNIFKKKIFVFSNSVWYVGVVGIVFLKIIEKYYRFLFLLIFFDEGVLKGFGRLIKGFNLFEVLKSCFEILLKFGGYEYAVGFFLFVDNIEKFDEILNFIV